MKSPRFTLNKEDAQKILKVAGWSVASTLVATLISLLPTVNFPVEFIWLVPMINTLLVAAKKFVEDRSK